MNALKQSLVVAGSALALMGGALWAARKAMPRIPDHAYDLMAALLFALGTFWFVSRALA